jgi:hypothetical protein
LGSPSQTTPTMHTQDDFQELFAPWSLQNPADLCYHFNTAV